MTSELKRSTSDCVSGEFSSSSRSLSSSIMDALDACMGNVRFCLVHFGESSVRGGKIFFFQRYRGARKSSRRIGRDLEMDLSMRGTV